MLRFLVGIQVFRLFTWVSNADARCSLTCPTDTFTITDASGNVVTDINGAPVNHSFTEISESTALVVANQISVGSGSIVGEVYLTDGPPALTGLTQLSDQISATTSGRD